MERMKLVLVSVLPVCHPLLHVGIYADMIGLNDVTDVKNNEFVYVY